MESAKTPSGTVGVLVVNLGTPDAPDRRAVRRYLKEFLWDRRVVEAPRLVWWLVLNLVILNLRPGRSARAYQRVWTDAGSPLLDISRRQAKALAGHFESDPNIHVKLAMRYGQPSIASVLADLGEAGMDRLVVLPMYPQYSATTTASVFDGVANALSARRNLPAVTMLRDWHDHPGYIRCLANSVKTHWAEHGRGQLLIMSFHGIPQEYSDAGDPYREECMTTATLLAAALGLDGSDWRITFQSRLGPKAWLQPYTDKTLESLPGEGIRRVQIMCPGFSADCLETLEEIDMENREIFMEAGGESYEYIQCLNDQSEHIEFLAALVRGEIESRSATEAG